MAKMVRSCAVRCNPNKKQHPNVKFYVSSKATENCRMKTFLNKDEMIVNVESVAGGVAFPHSTHDHPFITYTLFLKSLKIITFLLNTFFI